MRFRPRLADGSVNVSATHPLKEVALLAGGLLALVAAAYLIVAALSSWIALHLPVEAEIWLGRKMVRQVPGSHSEALQKRLDSLTALLPEDSPLRAYSFRIHLSERPQMNAVALPGGTIVVYQGLIDAVESENELAMVLGHELGHFAHRDHLKRMGKGIVLTAAVWLLFGNSAGADQLLAPIISGLEATYSRSQEEAADLYGLQMLYSRFGHVGGAVDFFKRIIKKGSHPKYAYLLATHPDPESRMERLKAEAEARGWPFGPVTPLGEDILSIRRPPIKTTR